MQGPVRYLPAFAVFLFLIHLGWVLVDPDKPLADPGTGWHVKLGQLMLDEGKLPETDPLSFTLPGRPWMDYQWLSHVLMGLLHHAGGLPLVTAGWSVLFGLIPVLMARRLMAEGVPLLLSWFLAFLGYLILTMHAQVRPHVLTYLMLVILTGWVARSGPVRWFLPGLFILWANFHAGFLAGLMVLACHAAGDCPGFVARITGCSMEKFEIMGPSRGLCGLATLVNPWGFHLHLHILDHMGMEMVSRMDEYQPVWKHAGANVGLFCLLAACWVATVLSRFHRLRTGEIVTGAVLLVFAVTSTRHVILFVIAALPVIGLGVGSVWDRFLPAVSGNGRQLLAGQLRGGTTWCYVAVFAAGFAGLSICFPGCFRNDFRGLQVGGGALQVIGNLPVSERIFHPETMGGVLAYTFGPERKIFVDDRLDYYGDDFYLGTYLPLLAGDPGWSEKLGGYGISTAMIPLRSGLARAMGIFSPLG